MENTAQVEQYRFVNPALIFDFAFYGIAKGIVPRIAFLLSEIQDHGVIRSRG